MVGTESLSLYDKLYLPDIVASYNETLHVNSSDTKRKLNNKDLAKLWHNRLGHSFKSRMKKACVRRYFGFS